MVKGTADLLVTNARIWTGNPASPWASIIAVRGDRILSIGKSKDVAYLRSVSTEVIDAGGKLIVPGFIDSHVHFLEGGRRLSSVQLRDAESPQDFVARIRSHLKGCKPGEWITGGDWDHMNWGGELPSRNWIDCITPDNPVWVQRLDGHMALANSLALKEAGISDATLLGEGGEAVRDHKGRLTGILKDNFMSLVAKSLPPMTQDQEDEFLTRAMDYVGQKGVTSVHHMGSWEDLEVFRRAHSTGRLKTRIYACVPLNSWKGLRDQIDSSGKGDKWLKTGGVKGFVDGSLGSRTAAFLEPYSDSPGTTGLLINSEEDLRSWICKADRAGLQAVIHAIGDRAIRVLINIYEHIEEKNGPRDRRFRIEHAQHLAPDDLPRLSRLKLIASMQPYHVIDDGRWAETAIGPERCKTAYAFRSIIDGDSILAFGSDWFVAPPSPILGIHAAVTRQTIDGKNPNGWIPEQRIGVEEALKAYTINASYASFEEGEKGSLKEGKLADFVLLDQDITLIAPEEIPNTKVILSVVGGQVLHRS